MALSFDPAIAAHNAFQRSQTTNELGNDSTVATAYEAEFSASAGQDATEAYRQLLALGERHPNACAFQEFLIYSTWQQAAEDPIAEHFQRGLQLCEAFLKAADRSESEALEQIRALRLSFLNALGITPRDDVSEEYDRDAFKGGD